MVENKGVGSHPARNDGGGARQPTVSASSTEFPPDFQDAKRYEIGSSLDKYQITGYLGRGGMGIVYRGFDPLVERDVALKVLPAGVSVNARARQRFLAEARAVGKLIHPNTTALYEVGEVDGAYFLSMEYVGGGSIASLLREQRLPTEQATRYLSEVCFGLAAAHEVGLIHRDIKPENLLRTLRDHVKITDFGLAKVLDALSHSSLNLTNPGSSIGTPLYMSPEQFSGSSVDARCDLYAAGATYFHLLTGKSPYGHAENLMKLMVAHCHAPVPDPRELVPEIPAAAAAIVGRAMAKRPEDRYETAEDMAFAAMELLGELCGSGSTRAGKTSASEPSRAIWVLEPSRMQARVLQQQLVDLGVTEVRIFTTIGETLAGLANEIPRGIISAMHLDDGSGDDLVVKLRAQERGAAIHCVLISSNPTDVAGRANGPGRLLVLPKPVTNQVLAEVLQRIGAQTK